MSTKPKISAEAMAMTYEHPFASDQGFLIALTEALAKQHFSATNSERVGVLNRVTAEHAKGTGDLAKARAEAAKAERERIRAILTAPEANGCEAFAQSLALGGDMPVSEALAALREASARTVLRSADAPGGLLIAGPNGEPVMPDEPATVSGYEPPRQAGGNTAKAMWGAVIADINKGAADPAAQAQAGGKSAIGHLNAST